MKPTVEEIELIISIAHKYQDSSPGNIYTFMREWQMCLLCNERYPGANYEPGKVFNMRGVDLIDQKLLYPPIQYKGSSDKQYKLGGSDKWSEECQKALSVDPESLFLFDFRYQQQMFIGKAQLLVDHTLTTMSPKHANRLGFIQI